jgi:hypothetical protein
VSLSLDLPKLIDDRYHSPRPFRVELYPRHGGASLAVGDGTTCVTVIDDVFDGGDNGGFSGFTESSPCARIVCFVTSHLNFHLLLLWRYLPQNYIISCGELLVIICCDLLHLMVELSCVEYSMF